MALFTVLGAVGANAFFVGVEFSTLAARRPRIAEAADAGSIPAERLSQILRDPGRLDNYIAGCQLGITVSSLILGAFGQRALAARAAALLGERFVLSETAATTLAVIAVLTSLTTFQIVMGESVPKAVAMRLPERVAVTLSAPMAALMAAFRPFIAVLNGSARLILRAMRISTVQAHSRIYSAEEIGLLALDSSVAGMLSHDEHSMLTNALELSRRKARHVMIPRNRLVLADVNTPVSDLLARVAACPFSRLPVYEDSPDNIIGIVHLRDLFMLERTGAGDVRSIVRPVPVFPENAPVHRVWQVLARQSYYLAVLLDEYGGTAGIITQEDLIEEIIGEIQDEFDRETARITTVVRNGQAVPSVRGDLLVSEVNHALGLELPTDSADTIAGLVVAELGRLGRVGDQLRLAGIELQVAEVRGNWIGRVEVRPIADGLGQAIQPSSLSVECDSVGSTSAARSLKSGCEHTERPISGEPR